MRSKVIQIGIDEAGCGCMAGDLFVSIVALDMSEQLPGVKDSKKLSDIEREELVDMIWEKSLWHKTVDCGPDAIDQFGLGKMWYQLVRQLGQEAHTRFPESEVILDGNRGVGLKWVKPCVKADDKFLSVMAASVLSKYSQTCCMDAHHKLYPGYGFQKHRGYVTQYHRAALEVFGPCPIHRRSYKPVQEIVAKLEKKRHSASCGSRPG